MIKTVKFLSGFAIFLILFYQNSVSQSIVDKYGQLSIKGNYIMGQNGDTVQLRGVSLFWSQWMGQYYDRDCIRFLADKWKCTVVRAAMGVEMGGYLENRAGEKDKVMTVVDAAIKQGIYVLIDYHSHEAHENPEPARRFFAEMAKKYGQYPNVIYEIYNEPLKHPSWKKDLKPYAESIIKAIREYDPDNIIVCGTRQWSQMVSEAAADPINDPNVAYTLHFYAGTHKAELREEALKAIDKGIALFVTEFGTCHASGNGYYDPTETKIWFDFMDKYKLSWCNWSVADKDETASILKPGGNGKGGWSDDELTESGKFIREEILKKNSGLFPEKKKK